MDSIIDPKMLLLVAVIGFITYWFLKQKFRGNLPPGPFALPIVGNMLSMTKQPTKIHLTVTELSKQYGPIFQIQLGAMKMIFLNKVELIKDCFVKQGANFSERPVEKMHTVNLVSQGKGVVWAKQYKPIRKFSLVSLRGFGLGKSSLEEKVIEEANALCNSFRNEPQPFDPAVALMSAVSNIICSISFGKRYEYDDKEFTRILKLMKENFEDFSIAAPSEFFPILRIFGISKKVQKLVNNFNTVVGFIMKEIDNHRASFDQDNIRDFVDLYLKEEAKSEQEEKEISLDNFKYTIIDLFGAGTDTTSTTLRWALILMMQHQEIQKKCREVMTDFCGPQNIPQYSDKNKMPYVEAVLMEIQRVSNITPFSLPHQAKEDATVGGCLIPKGSTVFANQYAVHMDPGYFEDPHTFNPDRWLDSEGKIIKNEAFIPFSIGPRSCLGEALAKMELFIFFSAIVQNFKIDFDPSGPKPSLEDCVFGITLSPKPFNVVLAPL